MADKWRKVCLCFANQNHSAIGIIVRDSVRYFSKRTLPTPFTASRSLTSAAQRKAKKFRDEEENVEVPKAADSHTVPSIFHDELVSKFVNCMMWDGKKSLSQAVMTKTFELIKQKQLEKKRSSSEPDKVETDPLVVFHQAVANCKPVVGVIPVRKAGKVFQVPSPLRDARSRFFSIKWLVTAARDQSGSKNARMYQKLAKELLDAYNNEGSVIKRKRDLHRMAESNRAFAHYRWW